MTVTVSVDATWRLSRVSFNTAHDTPWDVEGSGEVLLQEAEGSTAPILGGRAAREGEKKTYGTMPSLPVSRLINDVMEETVEIDGATVSFKTIMDALPKFFERWRAEDTEAFEKWVAEGTPGLLTPKAAPETPMEAKMEGRPIPKPIL